MAFSVQEDLMAVGNWSVDLRSSPVMLSKLAHPDGTPRDLVALVWDDSVEPPVLAYPPLVLRRVTPDDAGLTIGGVGALWHLGLGDVGPSITWREYISGASMLSNGDFARDAQYWRRASEDSLWLLTDGEAANAGGLGVDDVLEYDRKFGARPGNQYLLRVAGLLGGERWRQRILFEGRFNPANLLESGDFEGDPEAWGESALNQVVEGGQRSGAKAMRFAPIPKPESIVNGTMEGGPFDWTGGTVIEIVERPGDARSGDWVMRCAPNPQPESIDDHSFEVDAGAGWTDVSEFPSDIEIVNDGANAFHGTHVMRVGPVTRKQVLTNSRFLDGHDYWYPSSVTGGVAAEPDFVFYEDPGGGIEGGMALTTDGAATASREIKYLRATAGGAGVLPYTVVPGESYELETELRAAPNTDGFAYASLVFPHETLEPLHHRWSTSQHHDGPRNSTDEFRRLTITDTVPAGRTKVYVLLEVHDHNTGYYAWAYATLTRTRGNRAQINYDEHLPVVADTRYELSALVRAAGDMQVGNVRLGVVLRGPGLPDQVVDIDKGSTDFVWSRVAMEFRAPTGYETAQPFVAAVDVVGAPVFVDQIRIKKIENNSDQINGTPFPVVADQRYLLSAAVRSGPAATRGSVRVGVLLVGADLPDLDIGVDQGLTAGGWAGISTEVRPPEGYTEARPYVRSTDIEGDHFWVDNVSVVKADNNLIESFGQPFPVTPERTYHYAMAVRSGPNLQRGTLTLVAVCTHPDGSFQRYESPVMEATVDAWTILSFDFTPPSGFDTVYPTMIATDVEGDYWWADEGEVRDTDATTVAFDSTEFDPTSDDPATVDLEATAPEGTELVRCQLIVQRGEGPWTLETVSLSRIGEPIATAAGIAAELLVDPITGDPLPLVAGTIDASDPIPYDWTVEHMAYRAIWEHLCNVVASPPLEFKVNPTNPASIDLSQNPFTDHAPDSETPVVFRPQDIDVVSLPKIETNTEQRATEIVVIGAELATVSGRPFLVTATAQVPKPPGYVASASWSAPRTKRVNVANADHVGYAQAVADDLAAREAQPPLSMTVTVNELDDEDAAALGLDPRPPYAVGDWVYTYKPEAGLVGGPEHATTIEGETVFPRRDRVLSRTRERASVGSTNSRYRIEMQAPDGTVFPLKGIIPSDKDLTTLVIGDRFLPWEADPQGQSESDQYFADRARATALR